VVLDVTCNGSLIMKGNFESDYIYWGELFSEFSIWEFVRRVQKKQGQCKTQEDEMSSSSEDEEDIALKDTDELMGNTMPSLLSCNTCIHPCCELLYPHPQRDTHFLQLQLPRLAEVPVSIGLSLPRNDCKYSHLMLLLFKP